MGILIGNFRSALFLRWQKKVGGLRVRNECGGYAIREPLINESNGGLQPAASWKGNRFRVQEISTQLCSRRLKDCSWMDRVLHSNKKQLIGVGRRVV